MVAIFAFLVIQKLTVGPRKASKQTLQSFSFPSNKHKIMKLEYILY